jgi:hypothetical protein
LGADDKISIEEFRPEQTEELLRMWRESFEHGVGITDPHPLEEQRRHLTTVVVPNNTIRVALLEGLCLYTLERNAGARAFYEHNGVQITARGFEPQWRLEDLKYEWVASEEAIDRSGCAS